MDKEKLEKDLKDVILNEKTSVFRNPIEPYIKLFIEPFYKCNYNCSYCYLHEKNSKEINYQQLYWFLEKKFVPGIEEKIFKYLKLSQRYLDLILVGGELSIKPLSFFEEFFQKLIFIFENHFDKITISFLTNFFRPVDYYFNLHKIITKYNQKSKMNISISFCASLHEEFEDLNNFINKIYEADKRGLDVCCHIFRPLNELLSIQDKNLFKKIKYLNENEILEVKAINDSKYRNFIKNHFEAVRPVKCYAYNYKIHPDLSIIHRCKHQKFNIFKFKPKLFYFCDKVCSCAADESYFKKEILLKEKNESN